MSNIPEAHRCDLSGRVFPSRSDVRGGLSLDTGERLIVWADVSPEAARKLLALIDEAFPKNTPVVREASLRTAIARPSNPIREAADEEDAIEDARERSTL
jgi:hypothetical protein